MRVILRMCVSSHSVRLDLLLFVWCFKYYYILSVRLCGYVGLPEPLLFAYVTATSWQNQQNDCVPSKDSDQPGHPPGLIRVFAVRMKKAWVLNYPLSAQQRRWSDRAEAQADLSLRCAQSQFVGFVVRWLKCKISISDNSLELAFEAESEE